MARAKNTDRAEARRRFREARAAEIAAAGGFETDDDELDPVTGRPIAATDEVDETSAPRARGGFRLPNVRRDLADLPALFRERRVLYVPFILLLVAFVLLLAASSGAITDPTVLQIVAVYLQLVFLPPAILVYFLAGFLAPRSAYLVGLLVGLMHGLLVYGLVLVRPGSVTSGSGTQAPLESSLASAVAGIIAAAALGMVMAAFAAWYRNFLRSSQQRSRAARVEREQRRRAAEKAEARAAKRPAKPVSR